MKYSKVIVIPIISNNGNIIKNHYTIVTEQGTYFQSYGEIIAFVPGDTGKKILLDKNNWDKTLTTRSRRENFLCEPHCDTVAAIENLFYDMVDLN